MEKSFSWSESKNAWLKRERGVGFEEIVEAIAEDLLDVRENSSRGHRNQRVFIVRIGNYPWVVPFQETEREIVLITAFPDRRLKTEFDFGA